MACWDGQVTRVVGPQFAAFSVLRAGKAPLEYRDCPPRILLTNERAKTTFTWSFFHSCSCPTNASGPRPNFMSASKQG